MSADVLVVITRCTRNGVVAWQQVARQLGRSVDSVRCAHDPSYLHIRPWPHRCEVVDPETGEEIPFEPTDLSSPYDKGPGLKARILKLLAVQSMSAEILSYALNSPRNSVRARLDKLKDAGLVFHDGKYPRTWGVTEDDGTPRAYGATPLAVNYHPTGKTSEYRQITKAAGGFR